MKKLLGLSLFVFTTSVFATFPQINVHNLSGDYLDEKGSAYAESAKYVLPKVKISHKDIELKFNKKKRNLVISDPSTTVELDFDFSFLNVFKAFSFTNMQIRSTDKLFTTESEVMDLYINGQKYHMEELKVETDVTAIPTQDDEDITIIDGLILNAGLDAKKLTFAKFDDDTFDDLRDENPGLENEVKDLKAKNQKMMIPMIVRFIDFDIKEGIFSGKAKIDSYINLWLRLGGKISTNEDNSRIEILLVKAKLGIFSIRGTILKRIKRMNLDGVTVKGSRIIVDLKTVVLGGQDS